MSPRRTLPDLQLSWTGSEVVAWSWDAAAVGTRSAIGSLYGAMLREWGWLPPGSWSTTVDVAAPGGTRRLPAIVLPPLAVVGAGGEPRRHRLERRLTWVRDGRARPSRHRGRVPPSSRRTGGGAANRPRPGGNHSTRRHCARRSPAGRGLPVPSGRPSCGPTTARTIPMSSPASSTAGSSTSGDGHVAHVRRTPDLRGHVSGGDRGGARSPRHGRDRVATPSQRLAPTPPVGRSASWPTASIGCGREPRRTPAGRPPPSRAARRPGRRRPLARRPRARRP